MPAKAVVRTVDVAAKLAFVAVTSAIAIAVPLRQTRVQRNAVQTMQLQRSVKWLIRAVKAAARNRPCDILIR